MNAKIVPGSPLYQQVQRTLRESSGKFEIVENKGGQGLPSNVLAYVSTGSQILFIEKDKLRIMVAGKLSKAANSGSRNRNRVLYSYSSFCLLFPGADPNARMESLLQNDKIRNYITKQGNKFQTTSAGSYGEVILRHLFPDTDLRLYSQENGQLEFDWILWPGADVNRIRMQFQGNRSLTKDAAGNLTIGLKKGTFTMHLPESYYLLPSGKQRVPVQFSFYNRSEVGFKLPIVQHKQFPLVIDPDLLWGTFFDGGNANFDEYLYAIEFHPENQLIYCAGAASMQVSAAYAAALNNGWDGTFAGIPDALIYALTPEGQTIRFMTYLGGTGAELGIGLSVYQHSIFISGYTSSSDFPVTANTATSTAAFDNSYNGNQDAFVTVFNDSLNTLKYSTFLGGPGTEQSLTIRAQSENAFTVCLQLTDTLSSSGSQNYIKGAADAVYGGNSEAWIGRFTTFNSLYFGTYIGGSDVDWVNDFQLLSDGSIVFAGYTKVITEVNGTVTTTNNTKYDALFGRINVNGIGTSTFAILEKFGGTGVEQAWGIYSMGDSVSVMVGQTTSSNMPLGSGTVFQSASGGSTEGFIARINNDGSGGYKCTYVGGAGVDLLVSIRPIYVNSKVVLMSFGTTQSANLPVRNFNAGSLYSAANSGGQDMMFLICDLSLVTKYYLSYIGGSGNDYLGKTGVPLGSNHMYYNSIDSVLYVGTTTHSSETTHVPLYVGRGAYDVMHSGVPVFDQTKNNGINDTHVIFAIGTQSIYVVAMSVHWLNNSVTPDASCNAVVKWETSNEEGLLRYMVQRSTDGTQYSDVMAVAQGNGKYSVTDPVTTQTHSKVYYRIRADYHSGKSTFSEIRSFTPCSVSGATYTLFPTILEGGHFSIRAITAGTVIGYHAECFDQSGRRVEAWTAAAVPEQQFRFRTQPAPGIYYMILTDPGTGMRMASLKLVVAR